MHRIATLSTQDAFFQYVTGGTYVVYVVEERLVCFILHLECNKCPYFVFKRVRLMVMKFLSTHERAHMLRSSVRRSIVRRLVALVGRLAVGTTVSQVPYFMP